MAGTLFGRVAVVGLLFTVVVAGCGGTEQDDVGAPRLGPAGEVGGSPNPGDPNLGGSPGDRGSGGPGSDDPGSDDRGSDGPGSGGPGSGGSGSDDRGLGDRGSGDRDSSDQDVAWVPPGPGGIMDEAPDEATGELDSPPDEATGEPDSPPDGTTGESDTSRWYQAFLDRDCDAIAALGPERDQLLLYEGLGAACRAALRNDYQSWSAAEAALQRVGKGQTDCLDQLALRLLRDLVTAHQRAPNAKIQIVEAPGEESCD